MAQALTEDFRMTDKTLLVIGASGDVGRGISRAARVLGWTVVGAARDAAKLGDLARTLPKESLGSFYPCTGDVSTQAGARELWEAASAVAGRIDAVVISVNAPNRSSPLVDWTAEQLSELFQANLLSHFNAAKVMLPLLPDDGMLVGIGGGTADFVIPGMAPLSMAQAALRMMYRGLARERDGGALVRELMIVSMINGASKRDEAQPEWLTDDEIGRHVCTILSHPEDFPDPVIKIAQRAGIGRPQNSSA